jgi:hypothetical protein
LYNRISLSNHHSLETDQTWIPVIARISTNIIRLEREFHMLALSLRKARADGRISVRGEKRVRLDGPEEAGFEEQPP